MLNQLLLIVKLCRANPAVKGWPFLGVHHTKVFRTLKSMLHPAAHNYYSLPKGKFDRQLPKLTWSDFRKFAIRTLDINKGYHEKVIPASTFTFCFTKPVDKEVQIIIFTSGCNVHNKDEGLKHLCMVRFTTFW